MNAKALVDTAQALVGEDKGLLVLRDAIGLARTGRLPRCCTGLN